MNPGKNQHPSISLIIPCYNEALRLQLLFDLLETFCIKWQGDVEIIIIDDGSTDETIAVIKSNEFLRQAGKKGIFKLIEVKPNQGKGNALKRGVETAENTFVLTVDADMSMSPMELFNWLKIKNGRFDDKEVLIASRILPESKVSTFQSRRFAGKVFNSLVRLLTPVKVQDTQCGFKLYPAELAKNIFQELKETGWAHDVELLARATKKGYTITEMPVTVTQFAGSKVSLISDSVKMFFQVIKIRRNIRQ
jgi:dolichyl-phosphate beta-glucosyltransferase